MASLAVSLVAAMLAGAALAGQFEDAMAAHERGDYHVGGRGIPQDYVEAHNGFNLATSRFPASRADKRGLAIEYRGLVATRMTQAQLAAAQKRAREWKPAK